MSKNKAFWPKEGIRRQVPGIVRGEMLDAVVTDSGIAFCKRGSYSPLLLRTWEELFNVRANRKRCQAHRELRREQRD